jgi:hypothetical protein
MFWVNLVLSIWVILMVILIFVLKWKIARSLWAILRMFAFFDGLTSFVLMLVLLPWIALHELCHAILLILSGFGIKEIGLFPKMTEQGFRLGYVQPAGTGDRVFSGYVYIAPLLLGSGVVALYLHYGFGVPWWLFWRSPEIILTTFGQVFRIVFLPRRWTKLYLLFMMGNGAIPGESDWGRFLRGLFVTLLTLSIVGSAVLTLAPQIVADPEPYVEGWLTVLSVLAIQFTFVAMMDVVAFLFLFLPGSFARHVLLGRQE